MVGEGVLAHDLVALTTWTPMPGLASLGVLDLDNLPALTSLSGLAGLESCEAISLRFTGVEDFSGLGGLSSVEGSFVVEYNDALVEVDELHDLSLGVGPLAIVGNGALPTCAAEDWAAALQMGGYLGTVEIGGNLGTCPG